jgi:hypothetical protein
MNKQQIKKELRRSVCDDVTPSYFISDEAYIACIGYRVVNEKTHENPYSLCPDDQRTFFLLCAEAL